MNKLTSIPEFPILLRFHSDLKKIVSLQDLGKFQTIYSNTGFVGSISHLLNGRIPLEKTVKKLLMATFQSVNNLSSTYDQIDDNFNKLAIRYDNLLININKTPNGKLVYKCGKYMDFHGNLFFLYIPFRGIKISNNYCSYIFTSVMMINKQTVELMEIY